MSISTTESRDTRLALDALHDMQDRLISAEIGLATSYMVACGRGDANALAPFAPSVRDSAASPDASGKYVPWEERPLRVQTVAEIMQGSLDYRDGPSLTEVMQLVLNVAYGTDLVNTPEQARALLGRMASTWAQMNAEDAA